MIYSQTYVLFYALSYVVIHKHIYPYIDALRSVYTQNDLRSVPSTYLCSDQGADPYSDPCFKLCSDLRTDLYTDLPTDLCVIPVVIYAVICIQITTELSM